MDNKINSIKKAILFVNLHRENSVNVSRQIQEELNKKNIDVTVFSFEGKPGALPQGKWDVAFSLGGDGTVLYTARCMAPLGVPILPLNLGSVGFIACADIDEWRQIIETWEAGGIVPSGRCMFDIAVMRGSQLIYKNNCLNDTVISAGGIAKLIRLNVFINSGLSLNSDTGGQDAFGTMLGNYRSDGLIIATPTGSTAYSMAAGGPILDTEMEAVILNPVCPFTLSNRPFVLPLKYKIAIIVDEDQRSDVLLTIDGQDIFNLERGDIVHIEKALLPAQLLLPDKHSYYSAIRTKLFGASGIYKDGEKRGDDA